MVSPTITISQYAVSGVSPSGHRHEDKEAYGWKRNVSTQAVSYLDYGSVNNAEVKQHTETFAIIARVSDFGDANEAIYNLRLWISDLSALTEGTYWFNGFPSGQWLQDLQLTDASGYALPQSLPSGQNWWRDAGGAFDRNDAAFQEITGSGITDDQVTQFMYVSMSVNPDVPVATYGGDGGGLTYRLTYDYR